MCRSKLAKMTDKLMVRRLPLFFFSTRIFVFIMLYVNSRNVGNNITYPYVRFLSSKG